MQFMWNAAVCRIDVDTEAVLEGIIGDDDIPRSLIERANHSAQAVDCTWVLHGPPLYRVSDSTRAGKSARFFRFFQPWTGLNCFI